MLKRKPDVYDPTTDYNMFTSPTVAQMFDDAMQGYAMQGFDPFPQSENSISMEQLLGPSGPTISMDQLLATGSPVQPSPSDPQPTQDMLNLIAGYNPRI